MTSYQHGDLVAVALYNDRRETISAVKLYFGLIPEMLFLTIGGLIRPASSENASWLKQEKLMTQSV